MRTFESYSMIPKIVHYCWFGRGAKPATVRRCMDSWRRSLPDYRFVEWTEETFDIDAYPFAREAYDKGKFAFVADVARLHALYTQGGVYLDTDVEVLRSFDPFLGHRAFTGFERGRDITTGVIGAEKGSAWIKELLALYDGKHFVKDDGYLDLSTNVRLITDYMASAHGFVPEDSFQEPDGLVTIYPGEYFSPLDPLTRKVKKTKNTVAVHHYMASWEPRTPVNLFRKAVMRTLGVKAYEKIRAFKLKLFPKAWR